MEIWNGGRNNHSCLHWGHYDGKDWDKHRVVETDLPGMDYSRDSAGVRFDFVWDKDEKGKEGRMVWYIDGKSVMKASKPRGTRPMKDFRILINVAVGGNVCQGELPSDGVCELVLKDLALWDGPPVGWEGLSKDWKQAKEGKTM